jgi:hypothetical protein
MVHYRSLFAALVSAPTREGRVEERRVEEQEETTR